MWEVVIHKITGVVDPWVVLWGPIDLYTFIASEDAIKAACLIGSNM